MESTVKPQERNPAQPQSPDEDRRSRLVHRVGPVSTGLFPGWGPKL
jgi:hypothetical protein